VSRFLVVAVVVIVGCKSRTEAPPTPTQPTVMQPTTPTTTPPATPPATPSAESPAPAVVEGPLARLATMRGPHATFEAACEAATCRALDVQPAANPGEPVRELRIVAVTRGDTEGECAIALHTAAGWFLATQAEDAASCEEPSYVEVESASIDRTEAVAVVEVTVAHHTKNADDSGEHIWAAACGVGAKGPWCTHQITTACDPYVCVSDKKRWERTVEIEDAKIVVTTASKSKTARRDVGAFNLPR